MDAVIKQAIALRKTGEFAQSRALLTPLLRDNYTGGVAALHIAWSYDNEGRESDAVSYYQAALSCPLTKSERFDALFGLASTQRSLGRYDEALTTFEMTMTEYPDAAEVIPFYAMCLYNVGRPKEAISRLLTLLVSTTDLDAIKQYQRAILLYADDLDKTWD